MMDCGTSSLGSSCIAWRPTGVGGGEMNATVFLGCSSLSLVCFLLLLRPAESVGAATAGGAAASEAVASEPSSITSDNGPLAYDEESCDL